MKMRCITALTLCAVLASSTLFISDASSQTTGRQAVKQTGPVRTKPARIPTVSPQSDTITSNQNGGGSLSGPIFPNGTGGPVSGFIPVFPNSNVPAGPKPTSTVRPPATIKPPAILGGGKGNPVKGGGGGNLVMNPGGTSGTLSGIPGPGGKLYGAGTVTLAGGVLTFTPGGGQTSSNTLLGKAFAFVKSMIVPDALANGGCQSGVTGATTVEEALAIAGAQTRYYMYEEDTGNPDETANSTYTAKAVNMGTAGWNNCYTSWMESELYIINPANRDAECEAVVQSYVTLGASVFAYGNLQNIIYGFQGAGGQSFGGQITCNG